MEKANFTVVDLCRVMRVSRSGYYAWRQREPDPDRARRMVLVEAIHEQKRGSYGSRLMARELQRRGEPVGRSMVAWCRRTRSQSVSAQKLTFTPA